MNEPTITCPNCRAEIKLTESLAAPLIESTRREFEGRIAAKDAEVAKREAALLTEHAELTKARQGIDDEITERLKAERSVIAGEEAKKARTLLAGELESKSKELTDLQEILKQREEKLADAQRAQAELIRKQREVDDARRAMDLTIEMRVQDSLTSVRDRAKAEAEDALKLKVMEKEQTIASMQSRIEELKRRSEQGSQQLQGEVQEIQLEEMLRARFPRDLIEPVPKGEHGGDVIQRVFGALPHACGILLWESKRTKNWSDGWLAKVREDQRAAKADFAIIVSQVLPDKIDTFDQVDDVWITAPRTAIPVAIALRHSLIELAAARQASEGQQTKMELVYQYLIGPRFRHRIQAIVERFAEMHEDLDRERKAMTRLWAKREEQIHGVVDATAGMYGDLQGIAGKSLIEIEGLAMNLISDSESHPEGVP